MQKNKSIGVAIVGGTGYGAGELLRLFTQHPETEVISVISASMAGQKISEQHKYLSSFYKQKFVKEIDFELLKQYKNRVVFLALPHGTSAEVATKLLPRIKECGCFLIDLSGDFRLNNSQIRKQFYPEVVVEDSLQQQFTYGLTELNKEQIKESTLLSTPGCLASACILATAPLIDLGIENTLILDAKTGTSGGGKTLKEIFHHPTRHGNLTPYKILEHRHEPEISQALAGLSPNKTETKLMFVPHIIPTSRGIYVTAYASLQKTLSKRELITHFENFYKDSPFIRIREEAPELQTVVGTNFCDISVTCRGTQVVAMSALDNLVKGTAGQAIQNMNLICNLPETTGLWFPALGPT
jgi:N-acetyl-gamma-glutamyl-phosphate reductase common form